ncbi:adenylosuccinate lyase [Andreesenia angusta]|uniref:Adenylosuccinate lyase n=1 Tax=Andreesenia angusta TaxID=39480 RepID=A0A1S1V882_9FIRM|nr:adenylosuccinate lyase [Andreesenia angusta]
MKEFYENPLITRYASREMSSLFSSDKKFGTWRRLWIALAESEKELGLNITEEQIAEMKSFQDEINYELASEKEREFRHDVMAHIHAFGEQCPSARGIIHLGATSAFVQDNTDIIVMKEALELLEKKLVNLMDKLSKFALEYKSMPTLGFTHFQAAQLTTVGKRAALWLHDLYMDYEILQSLKPRVKMRGVKGTTGTQASFLNLFEGDHEKVKELDKIVASKMGFDSVYPVTGQTYSRKLDSDVLNFLSGVAQSLHKMTNDIRLLQNLKEIEEPFEKSQIGSSAMAYKRNPMRSERIASLARYIISNTINPAMTESSQWFERTLDDSANRRIVLPQSFLACDGILDIAINVTSNMVVYENVIAKHIESELPFMITENIIMEAVKKGGDRQELHETIRQLSMQAGREVKEFGRANDLVERIVEDKSIALEREDIERLMNPSDYIGRAPEQVEEFISDYIAPILEEFSDELGLETELTV